jgi:tripartite-type tricarboxylate transporter receptor subunit TctC
MRPASSAQVARAQSNSGGDGMKLPRREFLHLAASVAALPALSRVALAQAYPSRPVRIVAGYPPGGAVDFHARLIGQVLSERLGQQFVVENRPGAGGNLGTEAVVRAAPDGYTLLLTAIPDSINATLYDKLNFNFIRDIAPIAGIIRGPQILVLHPALSARSVAEFIAAVKANPGRLNMASAGIGTPGHLAGELLKIIAGLDLQHVPYRGEGPALTDVIGGQVQSMFSSAAPAIPLIRTGKLRAIAVTTAIRLPSLPDVPSISETIPGYEVSTWAGVGAPRDTPVEIITKLNREINAGLASAAIQAKYADLGYTMFITSPAEFGSFIAEDTAKWAKVIRAANIKAE